MSRAKAKIVVAYRWAAYYGDLDEMDRLWKIYNETE